MTWGWLTPVFSALGKLLGALSLVNHGKQKAEKKQLEKANEQNKKLADLDNTPIADDADVIGMLRNRRK
ncbi:hypothetical protein [Sulfurovum sp.]|uniref:hypothetical protein n=1 Tax=Sulfurovum sp. TaxID=1969726 RepID=UPI003562BC52